MLRFFSIVIFSLLYCAPSWAQSASWSRGANENPRVVWTSNGYAGEVEIRVPFYPSNAAAFYFVKSAQGSFVVLATFSFSSAVSGGVANSSENFNLFQSQFPYSSAGPAEFRVLVDGVWSAWGTSMPSEETVDVEWKFTSEWAGSVVEVVDAQGNVIATYGLPAVIGPEGYTLLATISAPDLEGAQVYLDGVPTSSLAALAASELVTEELDRPAYAFNFDGSYTGSSWEIRRADGGVAASGSAASLQTVLEGRVTIGGGEQGEVYVLTPSGDGLPSQWISTGVTVQGSSTTVHSFVNNPAAVLPDPMPTPAPVSTPGALQPAPTNQTTSPPSVLSPTNSEDYVSVDVEPVELEDPDDGEENVLETIGELQGLVSGIVGDMAQVQGNFVEASQLFNGLRLGGVGRNCQFSIGPASITLETSGTVRSGLTLLMIGVAAFGAVSMIRTAIQ